MSTVSTPIIAAATTQGRGLRPTSSRNTAVLVGLLFLTATAAFIFAEAINSRVLNQPNFLADASSQTTMLATGALLLFGQFGVVGIAVLMFPLMKSHGESLALAHVGFRVTELAASLFYLAFRSWRSSLEPDCATARSMRLLRRVSVSYCRHSTAWPF